MDQIQTGKFIAELRKEKGMTQADLGEKLGVTNKTISRWENGNYMPDISMLPLLCSELGISVNELISGRRLNEDTFKTTADHNLLISYSQMKAMKRKRKLSDSFGGAGTGLLCSCLYTQNNVFKLLVIAVGMSFIFFSWYQQSKFEKLVFDQAQTDEKAEARE